MSLLSGTILTTGPWLITYQYYSFPYWLGTIIQNHVVVFECVNIKAKSQLKRHSTISFYFADEFLSFKDS